MADNSKKSGSQSQQNPKYSGRRRPATRRSGHATHAEATGGAYRIGVANVYEVSGPQSLRIRFNIPTPKNSKFAGFGFYFRANIDLITSCNTNDFEITEYPYPNWNKCGFIWRDEPPKEAVIEFSSKSKGKIEIYGPLCGMFWHEYFDLDYTNKDNVIKNIQKYAPEAVFNPEGGTVEICGKEIGHSDGPAIKECNRCARFLPVNFADERCHLSFTNHCKTRPPCTHSTFGNLVNPDTGDEKDLYYGFQLECRFCKKFAVNAALNPQRTAAQMKEDGQRRRYFEALLTELNCNSALLSYREIHGRELPEHIWEKFSRQCFKCKKPLASAKEMRLDHTRPLALLWPVDGTATALCKDCNSSKRDRFPGEFYTESEIEELSKLTGLSVAELNDPNPNIDDLALLIDRLDWFYSEFLDRKPINEEKDGKVAAELICEALDRIHAKCDTALMDGSFIDGWKTYKRRS